MERRIRIWMLVLMTAGVSGGALAGDLNPPVGAVAPTHKTLTEVEPRIPVNATTAPPDINSLFRIAQPGSYYLTGNLAGVSAKHGIKIASSGVTLDMNGFELLGVSGSLDGITLSGSLRNIAVMNGSVRNWGGDGMDLGTSLATRVSNIRASANLGRGLRVGVSTVATGCSAYLNTGVGIEGSDNGVLSECAARQNGGDGVSVGNSWAISRVSSIQNTGDGINTGTSANVSQCSSTDNSSVGIDCGAGSTISGCSTRGNAAHGIRVSTACGVKENMCYSDGGGAAGTGAGILVSGFDNRIEGNNCTASGRGIEVDFSGNLILRNSARSNGSNYEIVANNVVGVIVQGPLSGAISGSTGGAGLGTTDPGANLSY